MKTEKKYPGLILLGSLLITAALFVRIQVVPFSGGESFLAANLAKLRDSFAVSAGRDILVFAAVYALLRCARSRRLAHHGWITGVSGLFAVLYVLSLSARELGGSGFFFDSAYQLLLAAGTVVGYWLLFDILLELLYAVAADAPEELSKSGWSSGRLWWVCFAVILLCRLPWLLAEYPATYTLDAYCQLREWFGLDAWTTHMPPFSTVLEGLCVSFGALIRDRSFGMFLYVLLQTVAGAAVFACSITLLRRIGCGRGGILAALLFAALLPLWGAYSQTFEKDYLHAVLYALCLVLAAQALWERKCSVPRAVGIALSATAAALIRNNTKYEFVPFLLLLCLCFREKDRKRLAVAAVGAIAVLVLSSSVLFPALGIQKGSIREALSIPFQQTARYVKLHGDEVTEREREVIDSVLVYDSLAEDYKPEISDHVKAGYREDGSKLPAYFRVWLEMLWKHPRTYLDALLCKSYGYLAPVEPKVSATVGGEEDWLIRRHSELGIDKQGSHRFSGELELLNQAVNNIPVLSLGNSAGFYFWIALACAAFLLTKRQYRAAVLLVPAAINMLVCIASPLHSDLRYSLWLPAVIPLLIGWTVTHLRGSSAGGELPQDS